MKLFDKTLTALEHSLDARLLRQNVLAGNLANAETPGFLPKDVDFAAAMAAADKRVRAEARAEEPPSPLPQPLPLYGELSGPSLAPVENEAEGHIPQEVLGPPLGKNPHALPADIVIQAEGAAPGIDGNGVDLDRTMVAMAQNGIQYGAAARAAGKKLAILRYVANDGNS